MGSVDEQQERDLGGRPLIVAADLAAAAAHSHVYADFCRLLGRFARDDYATRGVGVAQPGGDVLGPGQP